MRVTLEQINCDSCGKPGTRYTVSFPDGIKILDRCDKHDRKILAFREEVGEFTSISPTKGRASLKVSSPEDIARQRAHRSR